MNIIIGPKTHAVWPGMEKSGAWNVKQSMTESKNARCQVVLNVAVEAFFLPQFSFSTFHSGLFHYCFCHRWKRRSEPGVFDEASGCFDEASGGFDEASGYFDRASGGFNKASGCFNKASGGFDKASGGFNEASAGFKEGSGGFDTVRGRDIYSLHVRAKKINPSWDASEGEQAVTRTGAGDQGKNKVKPWHAFSFLTVSCTYSRNRSLNYEEHFFSRRATMYYSNSRSPSLFDIQRSVSSICSPFLHVNVFPKIGKLLRTRRYAQLTAFHDPDVLLTKHRLLIPDSGSTFSSRLCHPVSGSTQDVFHLPFLRGGKAVRADETTPAPGEMDDGRNGRNVLGTGPVQPTPPCSGTEWTLIHRNIPLFHPQPSVASPFPSLILCFLCSSLVLGCLC